MGPIAWLYLKMFLIFGLGFGVLMSFGDLLLGYGFQLDQFITRSISFGASMSILLVSIHVLGLRSKGVKKFSKEILNPVQKRSINSTFNKKQLVAKIATDPVLSGMEIKETENSVILKSDMSLFSYGNRINIEADPADDSLYHYEIESKPILKSTLLDYGTSYNYVTHLERLIQEQNSK